MKGDSYQRFLTVASIVIALLIALHWTGVVNVSQFIRDYQGLLGSLLGIVGTGTFGFWSVNETLRRNADNTKAQKDREIEYERRAVRATLLAELLVMYNDLYTTHRSMIAIQSQGNFVIPQKDDGEVFTRAYRALVAKIGLLREEEIAPIVRAYAQYDGLIGSISFLDNVQTVMLKNDPKFISKMNSPYQNYMTKLEFAINHSKRAIEALGGDVGEF